MLLSAQGQGRVAACGDQVLIKQAVLRTWRTHEDGEGKNGDLSADGWAGRGYTEIPMRESTREASPSWTNSPPRVKATPFYSHPPPPTYHSSIQGSGLPHCAKRSRAEMPGGRQSDPGCLAQVQDKWTGRSQMSPLQ